MKRLKGSEEIPEVREFWLSYIKQAVMKSCDALKTIDLEFQILAYRDTLPPEARKAPEKPKEKKKIEMVHIPKGAFGESTQQTGHVPHQNSGGVVKTFQETGQRITPVDMNPADIQ